jgi:hypothetical protein
MDKRVTGFGERHGEKLPWKEGGKYHQGIWGIAGRKPRKPAENQGESYHGDKRPQYAPGDPDRGLLIPCQDVTPCQEYE